MKTLHNFKNSFLVNIRHIDLEGDEYDAGRNYLLSNMYLKMSLTVMSVYAFRLNLLFRGL